MKDVSSIWLAGRLSFIGLFNWLNGPDLALNVVIRPIIFVVAFALVGRVAIGPDETAQFVIGASVMSLTWITLNGAAQATYQEQFYGTLSLVMVSPTSPALLLLSKGLFHALLGWLSVMLSIATGMAVFDLWVSPNLFGLLAILAFIASVVACVVGLLIGLGAINMRDVQPMINGTGAVLAIMSGGFVPPDLMPHALAAATRIFPLRWSIEAMRQSYEFGPSVSSMALALIDVAFAAVLFGIAVVIITWLERAARRHGTIDFI